MNQRYFSTSTSWTMWLLVSLFYAYQYIIRVLPNVIMPDIIQHFSIDAAIFGQISGWYYIGYAVMHIPIGIMLDRIGPKIILPISIGLIIMGMLPFVYSHHWMMALVGRFLIGIGSSSAILGVFKVIHMVFDKKSFTKMLGFSVTIGLIGAIYGGQPISYFVQQWGWVNVIHSIIIMGIVLMILMYSIIPSTQKVKKKHNLIQDIMEVVGNKTVLFICIFAGLMVGPLEGFADVWGAEFLKVKYNMFSQEATAFTSSIFIGMCFGATVLTWITSKFQIYYGSVIGCAFGMGIIFMAMLFTPIPSEMLVVLFPIVGVLSSYQIISISMAGQNVPSRLASFTSSIANTIIMVFGYVFHTIIGSVMEKSWDGGVLNGIKIYSETSFVYGLAIIPVALFVAGMGYIGLAKRN